MIDSVGPDGFVPKPWVSMALPSLGLPTDKPLNLTFKQGLALQNSSASISKHFAKRQVKHAVSRCDESDLMEIHASPIEAFVLVYHTENIMWEGLVSSLNVNGEDIIVLTSEDAQNV